MAATNNPSESRVLDDMELNQVIGGLGAAVKNPEPPPIPMPADPVRPGDFL